MLFLNVVKDALQSSDFKKLRIVSDIYFFPI